ncbi:hypothetical protein WJX81_008477 [Elliptochloris bilobata]|uniref:EF-hand domain-containing protein n=1 Tax=Elliptochloris bilobata TaxID=381761 RepID=A0AAW1SLM7_9CHLO
MGNTGSTGLQDGVVSKKELERLQRRFLRLAKGGDLVALADFQALPELAGNPLVPRVLQLADKDRDGHLRLADFTDAVGELGRLYTDDDRAAFTFRVYDLDGDGYVTPAELEATLRRLAGQALSAEQLAEVVAATVAAHDSDGDGRLSPREFRSLLAAGNPKLRLSLH